MYITIDLKQHLATRNSRTLWKIRIIWVNDPCQLPITEWKVVAFSRKKKREKETQCGNFRIFLSFRFYVKSILESLEVQKLPVLPFLGLSMSFGKCQFGKSESL